MQTMTPLFKLGALCAFTALVGVGCTTTPDTVIGASKNVAVNAVSAQGIGAQLGEVQLTDSAAGLVIRTNLTQLPPGPHGFHIHENGSCAPAEKDGKMQAALAAGGHFNQIGRASCRERV